jgi:uncharacterized membrane protein YagU involved in acid resistance
MKVLAAILIGGLLAGALDILYAFIVYGPLAASLGLAGSLSPMDVLHSVASGWIGHDAAAAGGVSTAFVGALTHFSIAIVMAGVYAIVVARIGSSNPILWGFLYGLILFFVMNYLVVPLSAAATGHFATSIDDGEERISGAIARALQFKRPLLLAGTVFTHTVLVGVPIALSAARFAKSENAG